MHRLTIIVLAVVLAAFLWANAEISPLAREYGIFPPTEYGPIGQYVSMRGWPLFPSMISEGMRHRVDPRFFWVALAVDGVFALVTLVAVAYLMELTIRRCDNRGITAACQFTLVRLLFVVGLLSVPMALCHYYPEQLWSIIRFTTVDVPGGCLFMFSLIATYLAVVCFVVRIVAPKRARP